MFDMGLRSPRSEGDHAGRCGKVLLFEDYRIEAAMRLIENEKVGDGWCEAAESDSL